MKAPGPSAVALKDVVQITSGGTPRKSNEQYWGGNIPWVSAKDMKASQLWDSEDHVTEIGSKNGTKTVERGDLLLLVRGMTLHNDIPICVAQRRMAFNQDVKGLRPLSIDGRYLFYTLLSLKPELLRRVEAAGHGTGRLGAHQIETLPIPRFSPSEEEEIAATLGALDDKIEVNRRMAATLEEMARALYRSWFVDFDPVHAKAQGRAPAHMDPATAALFPARFGDDGLPEGWEIKTIGEVAEIVGGATPSTKTPAFWDDGTHAWATPRDLAGLTDAFLIETARRITDQGLAKIGSGLSPAGSMLLSSRAPIGYRAIAREPVAVNQGFIVIRETPQITGIEAYLWCEVNMDAILNNANGSTFQEISKKNFRPIPYLLAAEPVRHAFDHQVRPMFDRMALLCEENRTLAALRDALLPKLMSGELRVREAEAHVEEVA